MELHGDLHLGPHVQIFTQLQSDFAFGKEILTPVDQNRLDLEQAFVAITESFSGDTLTLRLGRQQIAFDLKRFISIRDGPNVRQSYDAAWIGFEHGDWQLIALLSHPVQTRDASPFDDYSGPSLSHGGIKLRWQVSAVMNLSATLSRFIQTDAHFPRASGHESRNILDIHSAGTVARFDWDVEAMGQRGYIGSQEVRAWAVGSLAGYTFAGAPWIPRVGVQLDLASGDSAGTDHAFETFNPLFPNGAYFSLSGLTGYVNLIHAKASLTLRPITRLKLMGCRGRAMARDNRRCDIHSARYSSRRYSRSRRSIHWNIQPSADRPDDVHPDGSCVGDGSLCGWRRHPARRWTLE